MKYKTDHDSAFKRWIAGDTRIIKGTWENTAYKYAVQVWTGDRWKELHRFRTLADAKRAVEIIAGEGKAE